MIIKNTEKFPYNYKPSASEECKHLLKCLGISFCVVTSTSGSHSADIWVSEEDVEKFESKILGNTFIGTFRAFHFGKSYDCFGRYNGYSVSYLNKTKYENEFKQAD